MTDKNKKYIIWLIIEDKILAKKYKYNQFLTSAKTQKDAIETTKIYSRKLGFEPKIMGVSMYKNIANGTEKSFKNNVFF